MPGFLEENISDAVARGSRGGPRSSRTKVYTQSGRLSQNFNWSRPLYAFDISYGIKTVENFEEVLALFHIVMFGGPYEGFRMRYWNDYRATRDKSALRNVGGSVWQLQRLYSKGAYTYARDIAKPRAGAVIYDASGAPLTASVDTTTGLATVTGTPASWEGTFDVPVTFVDDALDSIELDGIAGHELSGLPSIKLEELKL